MIEVSVDEIKRDLTAYFERVEAGETLVVTHDGEPFAEIKPVTAKQKGLRPFGLCAGEFVVPDDFDSPIVLGIEI